MIFGVLVTAYFWRENIKGVEESGNNNVRIVSFVAVIGDPAYWSAATIYVRGFACPFSLHFTDDALGWAKNFSWLQPIGLIGIFMAFGHSILALSGLETLAQVYREIEDPKIQNLKKTVIIVFVFSIMFTGVLTFLSALIIPNDLIATKYADNLLSGLALEVIGPYWAKLILQAVVVVSGGLILIGAVNTSFVGANGMLNRVAEDGIMHDWFRHLHVKYGTTYRIINLVAITQIIIILLSRGNIFLLARLTPSVFYEPYLQHACPDSFRFKDTETKREWMFPLNIKIQRVHIPIGLTLVFLVLLTTGVMNLMTKRIATFRLLLPRFFHGLPHRKMNEKKCSSTPKMRTRTKAQFEEGADIGRHTGADKPTRCWCPSGIRTTWCI